MLDFTQTLETSAPLSVNQVCEPASKTKLVCTAGPACCTADQIRHMLQLGTNVFRLNFSHADHQWHSKTTEIIRAQADDLGLPIAIMQDLCGPKIRVSWVKNDQILTSPGDLLRITSDQQTGPLALACDFSTTYAPLLSDVDEGDSILVNDGRIELIVESKGTDVVETRVRRGGIITSGKGLNLRGVHLSTPSITTKDWRDLEWGIEHEVDYVALSFVRHPNDIVTLRAKLDEAGSPAHIIAKIERPEAIEHIDQIVELADGLMVARGDLGLETDLAEVPILQKQLIARCRRAAKPVITATQMLDSMVNESTPTRAEVSDIANAIFDGSDAIMLSNETAAGHFPFKAIEIAQRIAQVTEVEYHRVSHVKRRRGATESSSGAVAESAVLCATGTKAHAIVVYTRSGHAARMMTRYRLPMPIFAVTNCQATYRQLNLSYGVQPFFMPEMHTPAQLLAELDGLTLSLNWGEPDDTLVVVSDLAGQNDDLDTLHIHRVGP